MTYRPHHPRTDANQSEIRADLVACGFPHVWCDVSSLPVRLAGVDVYVYAYSCRHGRVMCLPVEIKMPRENLNENERKFWAEVAELGGGGDIPLKAEYAEDILRWFGRP